MKKSLAILAFIVVAKTLFAQDASWKGAVNFKKDVVNEVLYLCIDNIKFHANIEVTIYGSYSDGHALGRITKDTPFGILPMELQLPSTTQRSQWHLAP